MARALSGTVKRIERRRKPKLGGMGISHAEYVRILQQIERDNPFRPYANPAPTPTVIEMPVSVAPPVPEPTPEPMGGQPTEFPEPIREVTWRPRGPQDWNDDSEDVVGRCLTDYDPLADEDEDA